LYEHHNPTSAHADANFDGVVEAADSTAWIAAFNLTGGTTGGAGDVLGLAFVLVAL